MKFHFAFVLLFACLMATSMFFDVAEAGKKKKILRAIVLLKALHKKPKLIPIPLPLPLPIPIKKEVIVPEPVPYPVVKYVKTPVYIKSPPIPVPYPVHHGYDEGHYSDHDGYSGDGGYGDGGYEGGY